MVAASASAQPTYDTLRLERVVTGLNNPLWVTHAPGSPERLFIVEQRDSEAVGRIKVLDMASGELLETPFLEVPGVTTGFEQGLLGLAFHPDYPANGQFFVYYTTTDADVNPVSPHGVSRVERYTVFENGDRADPESAQTILTFPQPFSNHNGGWMAFGPDGFLYVGVGDGGAGNDPRNAAQSLVDDPETEDGNEGLLGKMLRLDVDADTFPDDPLRNYGIPPDNPFASGSGAPEIWAYGLRNPWRPSFDRETGDLWIADVGQNSWEEINFQPASSAGGENYGWRALEGSHDNEAVDDAPPSPRVDPVWEYDRDEGQSITGGYVYRGEAMPWLQGTYIYGDFATAFVRGFRLENGRPTEHHDWTATLTSSLPDGQSLDSIASFGEDAAGELYVVDLDGDIFRLTQKPYLLWQNRFFSEAELAAGELSAPDADPDGDGANNGVEYVLRGDPRQRDRPHEAALEVVQADGDRYLQAAWDLNPQAWGDYTLSVERSDNLVEYQEGELTIVEESPTRFQVRSNTPIGEESQFLRLDVELKE